METLRKQVAVQLEKYGTRIGALKRWRERKASGMYSTNNLKTHEAELVRAKREVAISPELKAVGLRDVEEIDNALFQVREALKRKKQRERRVRE